MSNSAVDTVMLVFVGMLLTESVKAYSALYTNLSAYLTDGFFFVIVALTLYWLNIIRIGLGYARNTEAEHSNGALGAGAFLIGVIALIIACLAIELANDYGTWENKGNNPKLTWALIYVLPCATYILWDFVLLFRKRYGHLSEILTDCLWTWLILDGILLSTVAYIFVYPDYSVRIVTVLIGFTVLIDFIFNNEFYFPMANRHKD